ncbi:MAG: hypothetical protein ACJASQ_003363 [Crocinitomicaceae bacterium]|jgi:hypothetical protein
MRIPTAWLFKIVLPASFTTVWYLKPSGACQKELSAIVAMATSDNINFFILVCINVF